MSSSDNNITYKKTSFLSGVNSEFINQFYSDYLSDPKSLPEGWRKFFQGLSENEKLVLNDLSGPSWSPEKKIKKTKEFNSFLVKNKLQNTLIISDTNSHKNIDKSARNIKNVKLIKEEGTNIYDLFKYTNVIITSSSVKKIQERLLNEKN